ncbi:MAG: CinA family nicotinamide mononucleotide deamidase-related protein [Desulfarculaceae bacterium]|nr:CinA family nicotinamide mononucleotide deamidase-related protein [Desulfarculaceae bacterium]MCF8071074.1 CinA family nicotinamide mononucleotide deamidase-related protein [Desulfarculaceae bacterium]MCF8100662.1 CinA family nicotinamide mononucleotide deamidase-related protein [Desulfarculaceae bacterium]MCF8116904.1 CinA family nicotinamide mononucleotide deamidase-related protein [Desulfarculaceae bacterium]
MRGAIICIGDELVSGRVADKNSRYALARLSPLGFQFASVLMVGDDMEAIAGALDQALEQADFVLVSGGLGSTDDDITASAAARHFGLALAESRRMIENLRECFAAVGRALPPGAERMAQLPQGAEVLDKACAGFKLTTPAEQPVYFLPGVPEENRRLLERLVMPALLERFAPEQVMVSRKFTVFGLGESQIGLRLDGLTAGYPGVSVGFYPVFPCEQVVLSLRSADPEGAGALLESLVEEASHRLEGLVVAHGRDTLADTVAQRMLAEGLTLALAESCTGGLVGHLVTGVAGSSGFFDRGLVTYSNRAKMELLGVKPETLEAHGAVSAETAAEMAAGARREAGTDLGLAVTGIAGPDGGTEEKPVGTVYFGLAAEGGVKTLHRRFMGFMGARDQIKQLSAHTALDLLRRYLEDHALLHRP